MKNIKINGGNMIGNDITDKSKRTVTIKIGTVVILIAIVLFVGFNMMGSSENKIIGTWQDEYENTFVFQESGDYSHSGGWYGKYQVKENILTLSPVLNDPEVYKIKISSKSLTLYNTDGSLYVELKRFK